MNQWEVLAYDDLFYDFPSHQPFHSWDFKLFNVELLSLLQFKAAVLLDMLHHYDLTES
jgi:hypothetical protein